MEDLLYEAESVRRFVGLRLSGPLPDETTILNFRHLLEERRLGEGLMEEINRHLASQGLRLREGTIKGVGRRDENGRLEVEWRVAMRPGRRRQLEPGSEAAVEERRKASIRAKVEHPFLWVKRRFGYAKVRYRGLAKNTQRLALLLGLAKKDNRGASPGGRAYVRPKQRRKKPQPPKPEPIGVAQACACTQGNAFIGSYVSYNSHGLLYVTCVKLFRGSLAARHKREDQLWFSLFHEVAHILLHRKRNFFVRTNDNQGTKEEEQANRWAADFLIPRRDWRKFSDARHFDAGDVSVFSDEQGISLGIVVGRLQFEKGIPYSHLNHLKATLEWKA